MRNIIKISTPFILVTALAISSVSLGAVEGSAKTTYKKLSKKKYKIEKNKLINKETKKQLNELAEFEGALYKKGQLYTGLVDGVYYKKGVKANGQIGKYFYQDGLKFSGKHQSFVYNTGVKANDIVNGIFYRNGKVSTGVAKNKKLYVKGALSTGAHFYEEKWYVNGVLDQEKNNAIKAYKNAKATETKKAYTEESWNAYTTVVKAYQLNSADSKNTVQQYTAATKAIMTAKASLVKSPAQAVIKAIKALDEESTLIDIVAAEELYNQLSEAEKRSVPTSLLEDLYELKDWISGNDYDDYYDDDYEDGDDDYDDDDAYDGSDYDEDGDDYDEDFDENNL